MLVNSYTWWYIKLALVPYATHKDVNAILVNVINIGFIIDNVWIFTI